MNKKQRDNTSRLLYRIVELSFAGVVIANLIPGKEFTKVSLLTGAIISIVAYLTALWLDKKE